MWTEITAIARMPALMFLATVAFATCSKPASQEVQTKGTVELTGRLEEILSEFPPNNLYDYVYVMKYRVLKVHRGNVVGNTVFVGHYNPLKPRAGAQDQFSGPLGGDVVRFATGDVHRMALDQPLDKLFMGGVVDKYFKEKGTRHWAIWTERAKP